MGTVVVAAVGLAILSFIAADLLGPNSALFGGNDNNVGEIAGEDISYQEYQQQIEELKYNFTLQTNRNPSEGEILSLRQQAWDFLIVKKAFQKQYDELGLEVTEEEVVDMVQGNNISPDLVQAFTDPNTGEFDADQVVAFLRNLPQAPPQQQAAWYNFEASLQPSRLRLKYDNLFGMTNYVTTTEAKRLHRLGNTTADIKYLYVPFYAINDSTVEVTDAQLNEYLENNKEAYEVEESRSISYVTFPIQPSAEDSAAFQEELDNLKADFESVPNDSTFAVLNSDGGQAFATYGRGQLPQILQGNVSNLSEGDVRGPYFENGSYKLYKISDIIEDGTASAKASHILFRASPDDAEAKALAREEAENVLDELQAGADFATMAREHSDDPSASNGGDLGWFSEGQMVPPFQEAVFGANSPGLINEVVETDFGFHLIYVTEPATSINYQVATLERAMTPSDESRDAAFRTADYFAGTAESLEAFKENAQHDSLNIITAEGIDNNARTINNLTNGREIVRWAYNEASVGDISEVFELENNYVVAVLTGETEEGTADLESVRQEITTKVKNQKKGEIIRKRLTGSSGSLEELAKAFGADANVYSTPNLKLNSTSIPNVGFAPIAVGTSFSLEPGTRSEPVIEETGVIIIELNTITEAPEIADFTAYKNQIQQRNASMSSFSIMEAIKDNADIEDERYKFF